MKTFSMRTLAALLTFVCVAMISGCGVGGGNSVASSSQFVTGRATITFKWPEPTRLIPAASNSIVVQVINGPTGIQQKILPRPAAGGSTTVSFDALPVGPFTVVATAYPTSTGTGIAQATARAPLVIAAGQNTTFSLTMGSTIDHLELSSSGSNIYIGSSHQLVATAKDVNGSVVLLSPSTLNWLSSNSAFAKVDATGLASGVALGAVDMSVSDLESGKSVKSTFQVAVAPPSLLYEGYNYPAGSSTVGLMGGTGLFGGPWGEYGQGYTPSVIQAGSLSFGNLLTTGNMIMTTSDFPIGEGRPLDPASTLGTTGTTLWISYLVKPLDALNVGTPDTYYSLVFGNIAIGKVGRSANYGVENASTYSVSNVKAVTNETVFLVARFTFKDGNDVCDLWVNPTPGQPLPTTPDAAKSDQDTGIPNNFNIGSSIRCNFDEIRFGRTYDEVSPVR